MKYSNELKRALIECGQVREYEKSARESFKTGSSVPIQEFVNLYGEPIKNACRSVSNSKYRARKNIETRFEDPFATGKALFLTLTFRDDVLSDTSEKTRRRYVSRFLKEYCVLYVANIDYGDKNKNPNSNEREHYHALALPKCDRIDPNTWGYGFATIKRVRPCESSKVRVSKYVAKLKQHALKDSCKSVRLIWSRGIKKMMRNATIKWYCGLLPF